MMKDTERGVRDIGWEFLPNPTQPHAHHIHRQRQRSSSDPYERI